MPTSDLPLDTQFATLLGSRFKASLCNKEQNMDQIIRDEAIRMSELQRHYRALVRARDARMNDELLAQPSALRRMLHGRQKNPISSNVS
jgi:hypothetical protein